MIILGWHGHPSAMETDDLPSPLYHDSAAVIVKDGSVVAAVEEERLNRVKHCNFFPRRAIQYCLDEAGIALDDINFIVTDTAEDTTDLALAREAAADPKKAFCGARRTIARTFADEFGVDVSEKLRFCRHHMAHLYGAWYPSRFPHALVCCFDGDGDGSSGVVAQCSGRDVRVLRYIPDAASLGLFYMRQLFFMGYRQFDEYKVMGLAPYGDASRYAGLLERLYQLQPDGRFSICTEQERLLLLHEANLFARARRDGQAFSQDHKDFAAALQQTLERIVDHVIGHFRAVTGERNLCLSGGVAHNCTMNGRLACSGRFDRIYAQPVAHDAGNALGAALAVLHEMGEPIASPVLPRLFLGPHIGPAAHIERRLADWRPLITFERVGDPAAVAARLLADGEVIGWVQGRSEFGPRALGNRSILADARPAENRRIVNEMIKQREDYRPFAPAVIEEGLAEYFEVPPALDATPFMIFVLPVRPEKRALLGAVTHIDGSARVQSVSSGDNPRFHALIAAFGRITGVPIVLNTSFNNNAEPIVDSADDAVTAFLTTGLHALVIDDWLIRRSPGAPLQSALLDLVPSLAINRKLVRRSSRNGEPRYGIESTANRFSAGAVPISDNLFRVLQQREPVPIRARWSQLGSTDSDGLAQVATEALHLWSKRALVLLPAARQPA